MPRRIATLAAALLLLLPPGPSPAATSDYDLVPERSEVGFIYTADGKEQEGQFRRFTATGRFDPEAPETATLELEVASGSISLGNPLVDAFAASPDWFDSSRHPNVRFRLERLDPIGEERYLARGTLEIRGVEQAVAAPVTLSFRDGLVHAEGDLTIDRRLYRLGTGAFSMIVEIGPIVTVRFALTAQPAR